MLSFAYEHKEAIKVLTSDLSNDLREFELSEVEWQLVKELCDVLRVSLISISHSHRRLMTVTLFLSLPIVPERWYSVLLSCIAHSPRHYSGHGQD